MDPRRLSSESSVRRPTRRRRPSLREPTRPTSKATGPVSCGDLGFSTIRRFGVGLIDRYGIGSELHPHRSRFSLHPVLPCSRKLHLQTFTSETHHWNPIVALQSTDGPGIYAARVQADPSVFHYNVEIAAALLPDPLPFLQGVIATGTE